MLQYQYYGFVLVTELPLLGFRSTYCKLIIKGSKKKCIKFAQRALFCDIVNLDAKCMCTLIWLNLIGLLLGLSLSTSYSWPLRVPEVVPV